MDKLSRVVAERKISYAAHLHAAKCNKVKPLSWEQYNAACTKIETQYNAVPQDIAHWTTSRPRGETVLYGN